MLKPSDLTKAELLQVMEILDVTAGYYLERALSQIERQRNDAHYEKSQQLIAEEKKHYEAYFDMLQPYEGKPITDIPLDVVKRAQAELEKAKSAGREWGKLNGIEQRRRKDA